MRKSLSILLTLVLMLSAASLLSLSSGAVLEGDWVTSRSANDYEDEGDFCPAPGYHYDPAIGFVIDPPEYAADCRPFVQAHTKNSVFLKVDNDGQGNAVNLKFTVLEYAYDGGEMKDQWIALTLNSQPRSTPGSVDYGEGICILIRGQGNGTAQIQPFYVDKGGKNFSACAAFPTVEVPMNDKDQEMYTFTVKYVDGGYVYAVNGHEFKADTELNAHFDEVLADGAYVGLLCQTSVMESKISLAITEWQGDLPAGDDSQLPEEDPHDVAPIMPSDSIPVNEPAVIWSANSDDIRKINITGGAFNLNADDTIHIQPEASSLYIPFNVKNAVSVEAADFPYIAVLTRNCRSLQNNLFYCAGPNFAPNTDYMVSCPIDDVRYNDGWSLGLVDLSNFYVDGWYGRINSLRLDFHFDEQDINDSEYNNFDIAFIAAFRSPEEAYYYTEQYLSKILELEMTTEQIEIETYPAVTEDITYEPTPETLPSYDDFDEVLPDHDVIQDALDSPLFQNGLVGELINNEFFEDTFAGCKSVTAVPVISIVMIIATGFIFKRKE